MKRILTATTLILLVAGAFTPAFSAEAPGPAELGAWWKDSRIVRELELREGQIRQMEQAVLNHRAALANLGADLEHQELILQSLVDASRFDEKGAVAQIDKVVAARGKLEKERTMMMLEIRRAVSIDQWNKLQQLQKAEISSASAAVKDTTKSTQRAQSNPRPEEPVYSISGLVKPPSPLRTLLPPAPFTTTSWQGTMVLHAIVDKQGTVHILKSSSGWGSLAEWAVVIIENQWLFKPGTLEGRPVQILTTIELSFRSGRVDLSVGGLRIPG